MLEEPSVTGDMFSELVASQTIAFPGPALVQTKPKAKEKMESIWPTGFVVGEQMRLFG